MMRTNLVISFEEYEDAADDISVLSIPSVWGDEFQNHEDDENSKGKNLQESDEIMFGYGNKSYTEFGRCNRMLASSVAGRAEMLTAKSSSPIQQNKDNRMQQRHLAASELKRQRLRRCMKHLPLQPSQSHQHEQLDHSLKLENMIKNNSGKPQALLSLTKSKSHRRGWNKIDVSSKDDLFSINKESTNMQNENHGNRCRECCLPITIHPIVQNEKYKNSEDNPQCTCFLPPVLPEKSNDGRNQKIPDINIQQNSIKLRKSENKEKILPIVRPRIISTSLTKGKAQGGNVSLMTPSKLSSKFLPCPPSPTPRNLDYIPPNHTSSFCSSSLQYSLNSSNTEENKKTEDKYDLFGPPSLIRTVSSAEETFSPREDQRQGHDQDIFSALHHLGPIESAETESSFANISFSLPDQYVSTVEYDDNLDPVIADQDGHHDNCRQNITTINTKIQGEIVESIPVLKSKTSKNSPNTYRQQNQLEDRQKRALTELEFSSPPCEVAESRTQIFCKFWKTSSLRQVDGKKKNKVVKNAKGSKQIKDLSNNNPASIIDDDNQLEETISLSSWSSSSLLNIKLESSKKKWWKLSSSPNSTVTSKKSSKKTWKDNIRWKKQSTTTSSITNSQYTIMYDQNVDLPTKEDMLFLLQETPVFLNTYNHTSKYIPESAIYGDNFSTKENPKSSTYQSVIDRETTIHEFIQFQYKFFGKSQALVENVCKAAESFYECEMYMESLLSHQQALLTSLELEGYDRNQDYILCNNVACSLAASSQYSQAELYFRYALSSDNHNDNSIVLINLGQIHLLQNEYLIGLECLNQALQQFKSVRHGGLEKLEHKISLAKQEEMFNHSATDFMLLQPCQRYEF